MKKKPYRLKSSGHMLAFAYRAYLKATALLTAVMGITMIFMAKDFYDAEAFEPHKALMPIEAWGYLFTMSTIIIALAIKTVNHQMASFGIILVAMASGAWTMANAASMVIVEKGASPGGVAVWVFTTAIHVISSFVPSRFIDRGPE